MKPRIIPGSAVVLLLLFGLRAGALAAASAEDPAKPAKKSGFAVLPYVYYTPETHWAVGAGGLFYFRLTEEESEHRPSNVLATVTFTTNKQYQFGLNPDLYFSHGYHLQFDVLYEKFPAKFFGIGNDTPKSLEEPYTWKRWKFRLEALKKTIGPVNLGIQYLYDHVNMVEVEPGGELASGTIPGASGGQSSGGGFFMTIDSRDSIFFPTHGRFHQVSLLGFGSALGSDFSFGRFLFDLRRYFGFSSNKVLAVQSQILFQTGQPPFWLMGMLGGEKGLRGYYLGRYRDRNMIYVHAEYRWVPIFWRVGLAGFAGLGEVADRLGDFRIDGLKYSYGLGLRLVIDRGQNLHVRLDYARGTGSSAVYLTAGEAF